MIADIRVIDEPKINRYYENDEFYITIQPLFTRDGGSYLTTQFSFNQPLIVKEYFDDQDITCRLTVNVDSIKRTNDDYSIICYLKLSKLLSKIHESMLKRVPYEKSLGIEKIIVYIISNEKIFDYQSLISSLCGEFYRIILFMNDYEEVNESGIYLATPFVMFAEIKEYELEKAYKWYEKIKQSYYFNIPKEVYQVIYHTSLILERKIPSVMSKIKPFWSYDPIHPVKITEKKLSTPKIKLPVVRSLRDRLDLNPVYINGFKTVLAR